MPRPRNVARELGIPAGVTLSPMKYSESDLLLHLRNANRTAFFTSDYISNKDHARWLLRYDRDTTSTMFTIHCGDDPVGFVSVTSLGSVVIDDLEPFYVYELGHLLIDQSYRRRGIMSRAVSLIRERYHRRSFWVAHVKPTNTASLRVFEKAGFWRVA